MVALEIAPGGLNPLLRDKLASSASHNAYILIQRLRGKPESTTQRSQYCQLQTSPVYRAVYRVWPGVKQCQLGGISLTEAQPKTSS